MNTLTLPPPGTRRRRRRYSPEFKAQVVAACRHPGVSIAAIALANQLNANLLRRWVVEHEAPSSLGDMPILAHGQSIRPAEPAIPSPAFVPIQVPTPPPSTPGDIRIELRRGGTVMNITWPVSQAEACAVWLRGLL